MSLRFLAVLPAAAFLCACDPEAALSPSDPLESERLSGGATQPSGAGGGVATGTEASTGTGTGNSTGSNNEGGSTASGGGTGPGNGGGGSGQGGDSSSISVGVGGAGACEGGVASIAPGAADRFLLRGTIVAESGIIIDGEILVDGNQIACVAASCAADPAADGATVVETGGFILPGMIDSHNHILFDIFDEDDWAPAPGFTYDDHLQWSDDPDYEIVVDAKQEMNGEMGSDYDLGCELNKYGEMKALIAGTTSVQGSPGTGRNCYGSLARSLDNQNDLPEDLMQTSTLVPPSDDAADGVCANFEDGDTTSYVIHCAEGVNQRARDEWEDIANAGNDDPGCLIDGRTTIVHGTALTETEFTIMGDLGMSLVWSPKSNLFLYGAGTDTTKTTDIPAVLAQGINVAIGPDWSLGGSVNLLDELRFADVVDDAEFGDILTPKDLFDMVTINPARAFRVDEYIGSLAVGKRADLFVLREISDDPYDSVLQALPRDVVLTMVDGQILYGDAELESLGPAGNACETIEVCCASKFACIAENGGAADRLDQTLAEITTALEAGLQEVAPQFMPLAPLVRCP